MEKTVSEAKKSLEEKIIHSGFVTSIGTRQRGYEKYIRVGVSEEKYISEIQSLLTAGKWEGHPVEIIVRPPSELH